MDEGVDANDNDGEFNIAEEEVEGEDESDGNEDESSEEETDDIVRKELGKAELSKYEDLDFSRIRSMIEPWNLLVENYPPEVGKAISRKERSLFDLKSSTLVYGEVLFSTFAAILEKIKRRYNGLEEEEEDGAIFYDIGSGVGKTVFMAALLHKFKKVVGIEILSSLHLESLELQHRWETKVKKMDDMEEDPAINVDIEFINGDGSQLPWTDATIVFCNSTCFDEDLMKDLASKANHMTVGSFLVTVTKRIPSEMFKLLEYEKMPMNWGTATVYIHQKK